MTAFNTVWTYDIYQSYIASDKSDDHYLWMGRMATVAGILLSICSGVRAAVQQHHGRAATGVRLRQRALFATFLLGMFWKRATGHGAFWGLVCGTLGAWVFQGLSIVEGATPGMIKGGWIKPVYAYHSEMGQNFWIAITAWLACMVVTTGISLVTARLKTDAELTGLVYSLTPRPAAEEEPWYKQPVALGIIILLLTLVLNIIFA